MTLRDGFPHASRLGFSARRAGRGDAGHREPGGTIARRGGDYLLALKANRPVLFGDV